MTVAELIAALRRMDPSLPVVVHDANGYGWTKARDVEQSTVWLDRDHEKFACVRVA